jgi:hypothetical protein
LRDTTRRNARAKPRQPRQGARFPAGPGGSSAQPKFAAQAQMTLPLLIFYSQREKILLKKIPGRLSGIK